MHPSVDPIDGRQTHISMPDQPLRLCLTSAFYPPQHYDGVGRLTHLMAQGLFACGHTVHVITRADREQLSFYDGAYVHKIPYELKRYRQHERYPNLIHTLNYSHAIHDKVQQLVMNDGVQIVDSPLWQFEGLVTAVSGLLPVAVRLVTGFRQIMELQRMHTAENELIGSLEQKLLQQAAHLIPNTRATQQAVEKVYDIYFSQQPASLVP